MLGIRESDVVFSAAKLFFAYGLGNSLTFPLAVGATTVLMAERPTPDAVFKRLAEKKPTIFYGVPTLYAALLASVQISRRRTSSRCASAPPPARRCRADIGKRWTERTGTELLDGIGSTEMLHIFLSNRPGDVRPGTTGKPVPGYELRLVDDQGNVVTKPGELGELQISGPTSAIMYWNQREKTKNTFQGPWTRSGDKYSVDKDGYYAYGGRSDDMLKVSGIYVSPVEVEAALITHEAVLEAAVVGAEDESKLVKPKAYVVLKPGHSAARCAEDRAAAARQGQARALQVPALDRVPQRAAQDRDRQDPAVQAAVRGDQPRRARHPARRELAGREQAARHRRRGLGEDDAVPLPERGLVRRAEGVRGASASRHADGHGRARGRARASRPHRRARDPAGRATCSG